MKVAFFIMVLIGFWSSINNCYAQNMQEKKYLEMTEGLIKNLNDNCPDVKELYQFWQIKSMQNEVIETKKIPVVISFDNWQKDVKLYPYLDIKNVCYRTILDNEIQLTNYEVSRRKIVKDYNEFYSYSSLIFLKMVRSLYDKDDTQSVVLNNIDELNGNLKQHLEIDPNISASAIAGIIKQYSVLNINLDYSMSMNKKILEYRKAVLPVFQEIQSKLNIVSDQLIHHIIPIGLEKPIYDEKLFRLIKAIKNEDREFLSKNIQVYENIFEQYPNLSDEYNKNYHVDYGFDEIIDQSHWAMPMAFAYLQLENLPKVQYWIEESELINDEINFLNSCDSRQLTINNKLDKFLKSDAKWYIQRVDQKRKKCIGLKQKSDILKKFDNYSEILERLENNCSYFNRYYYTKTLRNSKNNYLRDYDFYQMIVPDSFLDGIIFKDWSKECKQIVLRNNKALLEFYTKNMPSDSFFFEEAKEHLQNSRYH
ncbi:hypothetical protein F4U02_06175 [Acinetobacter haemolyticus]|uniref:hypothetical protein n=1 Tax=Acinetobacter haemolyticus TaxID=29430 RepID=UPI0012986006|nr:hypothetical protein [Acinetobacter haemolyticus]MQZ30584.1 hypothetical protein [Acinetobacter haemolyticus]